MSELKSTKCPVCLTSFNGDKHIPKISPTCGHTICKECLIQVLKAETPKCPLDNLKFASRSIDTFPTNLLGRDLLETVDKRGICELHEEQKKIICLTDNALICPSCAIFGDHKSHQVKSLSSFTGVLNQKKNQFLTLTGKMSELTNDLESRRDLLKAAIEEKFQKLHDELEEQQTSLLLGLENIFASEKIRLNSMVSKSLDLPFDIQAKLKELDNAMSDPNIIKLVEEDFSGIEKAVEEKFAPFKTKFTEEISGLLAVFESNILKEELVKDIIGHLNQELNKVYSQREVIEQKACENKDIPLASAELKISNKDSEKGSESVQ